ncbi:MAG: GAF domain-containing protein [Gammaproteobacteria bacterium]
MRLHRVVSFCGQTLLANEPLVIPDTHLDDRFADNLLVVDKPNIRFYAGLSSKSH